MHLCTLQMKQLHEIDLSQLSFVGEALTALRKEVRGQVSKTWLPC